jgi:hypothetical protein
LDEWKDSPEIFIEQSVPTLRAAIYRVQPFAKDWDDLRHHWRKSEAKDKKNTKLTAFFCLVDDIENKHGIGKTAFMVLYDCLDEFDDCVA